MLYALLSYFNAKKFVINFGRETGMKKQLRQGRRK